MDGGMPMLPIVQFYPPVPSTALPDLLLFTFSFTVSWQHNIVNLSFTHLKKQSSQIFFTKYFTLFSPAKRWSWLTYPSESGKGNVTGGSMSSFQCVLSRTVHHCLELFIRKVSTLALDTAPHERSLESKSQLVLEHLPKILNSDSFSSTLFTFLRARELMPAHLEFSSAVWPWGASSSPIASSETVSTKLLSKLIETAPWITDSPVLPFTPVSTEALILSSSYYFLPRIHLSSVLWPSAHRNPNWIAIERQA